MNVEEHGNIGIKIVKVIAMHTSDKVISKYNHNLVDAKRQSRELIGIVHMDNRPVNHLLFNFNPAVEQIVANGEIVEVIYREGKMHHYYLVKAIFRKTGNDFNFINSEIYCPEKPKQKLIG